MSSELGGAVTTSPDKWCDMAKDARLLQIIDLNELGADLEPLTAYLKGCKKAFQASPAQNQPLFGHQHFS